MSCHGFYAEIQSSEETAHATGIDHQLFENLEKEYSAYKTSMMKNLEFDPTKPTLGLSFKTKNSDGTSRDVGSFRQ